METHKIYPSDDLPITFAGDCIADVEIDTRSGTLQCLIYRVYDGSCIIETAQIVDNEEVFRIVYRGEDPKDVLAQIRKRNKGRLNIAIVKAAYEAGDEDNEWRKLL